MNLEHLFGYYYKGKILPEKYYQNLNDDNPNLWYTRNGAAEQSIQAREFGRLAY